MIERSAALTVVCLLTVTVPNSLAEALAVFVMVPACVGLTTIATVADCPSSSLPTLQVTVSPDRMQSPWLELTETNVIPLGKVSVMVTPSALSLPLLITVKV